MPDYNSHTPHLSVSGLHGPTTASVCVIPAGEKVRQTRVVETGGGGGGKEIETFKETQGPTDLKYWKESQVTIEKGCNFPSSLHPLKECFSSVGRYRVPKRPLLMMVFGRFVLGGFQVESHTSAWVNVGSTIAVRCSYLSKINYASYNTNLST